MVDGNAMIKILYEDNHVLVVLKPANIPVQEDSSKDEDLLTMLKKYIKEKYNKPGNVYLGLVHRLDRPVSGIMVFAKTSKAASRLSEQVRENKFIKKYKLVVHGELNQSSGILFDRLLKDTRNNIVKVSPNGKDSSLEYKVIDYDKTHELSLIEVKLITGRSHQIRVQFSSRNHPLYADQKYNPTPDFDNIALFAYHLEFFHPTTKQLLVFEENLPNKKPWNYFS